MLRQPSADVVPVHHANTITSDNTRQTTTSTTHDYYGDGQGYPATPVGTPPPHFLTLNTARAKDKLSNDANHYP